MREKIDKFTPVNYFRSRGSYKVPRSLIALFNDTLEKTVSKQFQQEERLIYRLRQERSRKGGFFRKKAGFLIKNDRSIFTENQLQKLMAQVEIGIRAITCFLPSHTSTNEKKINLSHRFQAETCFLR